MVNVVLIYVLYSFFLQLVNFGLDLFSMVGIFANIPLFCVIVYYTYKLIRRCCCSRGHEYHEIQAEGDDHYQGEHLEPPQDEAFF